MTARRPADIAAELRANWGTPRRIVRCADELDALDARWPTADEIAGLREDADLLVGCYGADSFAGTVTVRLTMFLDKLDPPEPAPQADDDMVTIERSAVKGVLDYLSTENDTEPWYIALRAALDARGQS